MAWLARARLVRRISTAFLPPNHACFRYNSRYREIRRNPRMSFFTREQCLQRLRAQVAAGRPIIGGGAGTGISAKCAEAGGIHLIIIYNSGRVRMAGRGSLSRMMPYVD